MNADTHAFPLPRTIAALARPDEFSEPEDMANGVRTLALAVMKLAGVAETCDDEDGEGGKAEL